MKLHCVGSCASAATSIPAARAGVRYAEVQAVMTSVDSEMSAGAEEAEALAGRGRTPAAVRAGM